MRISQVRNIIDKYSRMTKCSDNPDKAVALEKFSKILAEVDKKSVAYVIKKLDESKKAHG